MTEDSHSDNPFSNVNIDRRTFVRLSATTAGVLSLPGNAASSVSSPPMTEEYEYVLNHTAVDYEVQTLIEFSDEAGLASIDALGIESEQTREPVAAAYAELSTGQAEQVAELPTAETLSHSPGANPFWRLGYYPFGVFPDPHRSTDYIDYEEMIAGLEHLESENADRMEFYSIGKSPGWHNYLTDREDPKDVYVAEVTNDIDDEESFREKQKVLFSLSIHGLEREGVESGTRFIENLLAGRESETEALLDDLVLVFVYSNPDGWVAKHPQYESYAPGVPTYYRGNAEVGDTNRQYPITGWIDPAHFPAEPDGSNYRDDDPGVDSDVPAAIREHVPDTLAIVEHFRDYENMDYGADMHGAAGVPEFVLGLISQDQFDHRQLHELYQMNRAVDEVLEEALTTWNTAADAQKAVTGGDEPTGLLPREAFDYSAIWDTLGYTDSGFMGDWFSHPKALGSLGMTAMDFEMNLSGGVAYNPELVRMQVLGYVTAIRKMAQYAVQNSDTPHTDDEFEATVDTGGLSTAYVTTDALTRSSAQIEETDGDTDRIDRDTDTVALQGATTRTTATVPADTHTMSVFVEPDDTGFVRATLRSPAGESVRSFDPAAAERLREGTASWSVRNPTAGDWTISLEPATSADVEGDSVVADVLEPADAASITVATLQSTAETPDPEAALGYGQRDYKASPFVFFDTEYVPDTDELRTNEVHRDYDDVTDAPVDPLTLQEVKDGRHREYDNLVVIHDEARDDDAYIAALESFVDDGGNLVLTDSGVRLLGSLDTDLSSGITTDDVETDDSFYIAHLGDKNPEHPLLGGTREIQQALWKVAPLGYSIANEAPMTLVDRAAFEESGGNVAATTEERVAAGTLLPDGAKGTVRDVVASDDGSIQVVSSLLPPAKQTNLHPFGVLDYALSFLGHTMLTNALGYVQRRFVEDEEVATFGGEAEY